MKPWFLCAQVAQPGLERFPPKEKVEGSNPSLGTLNINFYKLIKFFHEMRTSYSKEINPLMYLFTGLSGAGKTTLLKKINPILQNKYGKKKIVWYDGDRFREFLDEKGIEVDFSLEGRRKNLEHLSNYSLGHINQGKIVLASFVSPTKDARKVIENRLGNKLRTIYVDCLIETCVERDVKGLYAKALAGEIKDFTGISSPFESPENPDLILHTDEKSVDDCVALFLNTFGFLS